MKSVGRLINDLTGHSASTVNYDRLAREFSSDIRRMEATDRRLEAEYYEPSEDMSKFDKLKSLVAKALSEEVDDVNGNIPVVSRFEAYQSAKSAYSENKRDVGVANLVTHLERSWKADREASMTADEVMKLKAHYERNFPKSAAKVVLDDMVKNGYFDLPVNELLKIASEIRTQADYEYQITANGLASNSPRNKKARQFILSAINGGRKAWSLEEMQDLNDQYEFEQKHFFPKKKDTVDIEEMKRLNDQYEFEQKHFFPKDKSVEGSSNRFAMEEDSDQEGLNDGLIDSIKADNVYAAKQYIDLGADPNVNNGAALNWAVWSGYGELLDTLLEHGVTVTEQAIFTAKSKGYDRIADLLIENFDESNIEEDDWNVNAWHPPRERAVDINGPANRSSEDSKWHKDMVEEALNSLSPKGASQSSKRRKASSFEFPSNLWGVEVDGILEGDTVYIGVISNMDYATNFGGPCTVYLSSADYKGEQGCLEEAYDMMFHEVMKRDEGQDREEDEDGEGGLGSFNADGYSATITMEELKAAINSYDNQYNKAMVTKILDDIEEPEEDLDKDASRRKVRSRKRPVKKAQEDDGEEFEIPDWADLAKQIESNSQRGYYKLESYDMSVEELLSELKTGYSDFYDRNSDYLSENSFYSLKYLLEENGFNVNSLYDQYSDELDELRFKIEEYQSVDFNPPSPLFFYSNDEIDMPDMYNQGGEGYEEEEAEFKAKAKAAGFSDRDIESVISEATYGGVGGVGIIVDDLDMDQLHKGNFTLTGTPILYIRDSINGSGSYEMGKGSIDITYSSLKDIATSLDEGSYSLGDVFGTSEWKWR